jgi:hypothetical protein
VGGSADSTVGASGAAAAIDCGKASPYNDDSDQLGPDSRQSFSGTNGTSSDECDVNGDLTRATWSILPHGMDISARSVARAPKALETSVTQLTVGAVQSRYLSGESP